MLEQSLQSQQRMSAGLAELKAVRADILQLVNTARSLQQPHEAHGYHPTTVDVDGGWPPPPLWLSNTGDVPPASEQPTVGRLDRLMSELQLLRNETLAAKPNVAPVAQPLSAPPTSQPFGPTYPSNSHDPTVTQRQRPAWSSLPPPPPQLTSTPYGVPLNPTALRPPPVQCPPPPQGLPYATRQAPTYSRPSYHTSIVESAYRGPRATIPNFSHRDPGEFTHLKIALENLLPVDSTEMFKYQVYHLKLEEAKLIADAYIHSQTPFTDTMMALNEKFGQPHLLTIKRIAEVMDTPDIRRGDAVAFDQFSLQIQSLVGMLKTLGPDGEVELLCGTHVARLLSKLPPEQRADFRRCMFSQSKRSYTLYDLAQWQKHEAWCQDFDGQLFSRGVKAKPSAKPSINPKKPSVTVLHGTDSTPTVGPS
ncbi:hypothetical protein AALO_G00269700 [Alosa alosa]|uniref:Uncharacterized protein n=1 Tax=Alosa alosa TaxID=278164 RepID=A0AAV6FLZ6_9TELE|nr:hypothetical protein AALO_G00269700 [Alosa alosa]